MKYKQLLYKTLYRPVNVLEIIIAYVICFGVNNYINIMANNMIVNNQFIGEFIRQIIINRFNIATLLSLIALLLHYQLVKKRKCEIHCKILVGDTRYKIMLKHLINNLIVLSIVFVIALIQGINYNLIIIDIIYLYLILIVYIIFSIIKVNYYESL